MNLPDDLKYTKEHAWVTTNGKTVTIGISDFAQDQLGEIVFVELPEEGEEFSEGDAFGVVESVKSVSDVYAPVAGKVVELNDPVVDSPEIINDDCYGDGWLIKLEVSDASQLDELMSAKEYAQFLKEESE
ncbi:MAG: glycine cleavage system protein GcvH [Deltaproteobacteria bacterium]|nr:MAG: glycine cleavage system protein GcvH [Deltaproteobacteria bacterium]